MPKGKKAGRIISIAATALNAALWLGASVYFARPFMMNVESAEGPAMFVYLIFLICCIMGFVNAALLLLGVILYHKSHGRSALICALLLYICPAVIASVFFGLTVSGPIVCAGEAVISPAVRKFCKICLPSGVRMDSG